MTPPKPPKGPVKLSRKAAAPRNAAAKALRSSPLFRPKVEDKPDAYRRRGRHKPPPLEADED
jgi:stalled ribosome alternative rescue factor ArfA